MRLRSLSAGARGGPSLALSVPENTPVEFIQVKWLPSLPSLPFSTPAPPMLLPPPPEHLM